MLYNETTPLSSANERGVVVLLFVQKISYMTFIISVIISK